MKIAPHPGSEGPGRVLLDSVSDTWFEIEPDRFTFGFTRASAERRHADLSAQAARYSLTRLRLTYPRLHDVTERQRRREAEATR